MLQPDIADIGAVEKWLGLSSGDNDSARRAQAEEAWHAAEAYLRVRVRWADDPGLNVPWPPAPADLVQAVKLLTARYLARRNSPDGLVGMGDLGVVRVATVDRDVDRLIAPYRRMVLA